MDQFKIFLTNLGLLARYNMRIIFGGKFLFFILAAFLFFLLFGTIMAFEESRMEMSEVYGLLILPAVLLVFYPTVFGIQNDADQRTLEIIFGIPDYRYKVWLVRFLMVLVLVFVLLFPFAGLAYWALVSIPVFKMVIQLMVLVFFVASLGFVISTIARNGNAAAVIMVIIGIVLLVLTDSIHTSKWNIFLNPFQVPWDLNEIVWKERVMQNRLMMLGASVAFVLVGLLNLQKREKFL